MFKAVTLAKGEATMELMVHFRCPRNLAFQAPDINICTVTPLFLEISYWDLRAFTPPLKQNGGVLS